MTTKPEEIARAFKVGDRVRVRSLPGPAWSMSVGHEFAIASIDHRGAHQAVMYGTHFIPLECLELLDADPAREERSCRYRMGDEVAINAGFTSQTRGHIQEHRQDRCAR